MAKRFSGFTKKMPQFFRELEKNNERDWFGPRKGIFDQEVRLPMVELVTLLNQEFATFAADHVADEPARTIYRIYRDTRFSKDKTPYKTHLGATFAHRSLTRHGGAGFYFEISHRYVGIAGGVYMPGPDELKVLRSAIAADSASFLKMVAGRKKMFGTLLGESLKRLPKEWKGHEESPVEAYLRMKQFYWWKELPASLATTPKLAATLVKHFKELSDGLGWFNNALMADRQKQEAKLRPKRPAPMW